MSIKDSNDILRILAVDPGETTGIVAASVTMDAVRRIQLHFTHHLPYDSRFWLHELIGKYMPDVLLVETFRLYKHKRDSQVGSAFETVRVIGILELSHYLHMRQRQRPISWIEQPASIMERVEVLDEHEVDLRGKRHATSAYKHLRYFVTTRGHELGKFLLPKSDGSTPPA